MNNPLKQAALEELVLGLVAERQFLLGLACPQAVPRVNTVGAAFPVGPDGSPAQVVIYGDGRFPVFPHAQNPGRDD